MGFWGNLFGRSISELAPGRGWTTAVHGESQYQDALLALYRKNGGDGHDLKVTAVLVPEPGNKFDPNAVRIEIGSKQVGYFPRLGSAEYRKTLGDLSGQCSAKIVGGFVKDDGTIASYGVKLNMA